MNFLHNIGKQTNTETNIENNDKQPYYTPFQIEQIRDFKLPISYLEILLYLPFLILYQMI